MTTKKRQGPLTHGVLLDHDPKGRRRLTVTAAGPSKRKNGRRLQNVVGENYEHCIPFAQDILRRRDAGELPPLSEPGSHYLEISEDTAVQLMLLMEAVPRQKSREKAQSVGRAVVDMHPCESNWWHACYENRHRPTKIMDALALVYA